MFGKKKKNNVAEVDVLGYDEEHLELEEYQEEEEDEAEYFEDEDGNLYSKDEYGIDEDGELYLLEDYFQDEDGNLYSKDEYIIGEDGLLYSIEEYEEEVAYSEYDDYEDEEEFDDEDEEGMVIRNGDESIFQRMKNYVQDMHVMDLVIAFTAVMVVVVGIFAFASWRSAEGEEDQVEAMAPIGEELVAATSLNAGNLVALKDAYVARINSVPSEEELNVENVEVTVNFTSIQEDLKIKFSNKETGELITGVLFAVELTGGSDKTITLSDDNKDGMIYESNIKAGTYDAICKNVGGFSFPQTATSVVIKDQIAYEKIYIADEVKTEDEVDSSVEDTTVEDTKTEATLKDTVEYVASTKTEISGANAYNVVEKSSIPNPSLLSSRIGAFMAMAGSREGGADTTPPTGVPVESVSLDQTSASVEEGKSVTLTATVSPDNANNKNVTWSSSADGVASVSNGTITGKSAGSATITVTTEDGDKTATCTVTVTAKQPSEVKVTGVSLDASTVTLTAGDTKQLTATISPTDATNKGVNWSSSNASVTVDSNGLITAASAGTATITATAKDGSGKAATCTVTVNAKAASVTGLSVNKESSTILAGQSDTVVATVSGESGHTTGITATSNNTACATVSVTNTTVTIKGVAEGTANITVTTNGKDSSGNTLSKTIKVTVSKNTTLTLSDATLSLLVGKTHQLKATVANTSNLVKYTSSDDSVASVGADGTVTAKKIGTVTITAEVDGVKATCKVTVASNPELDKTTKLKDSNGVQVYVKDGTAYREAVYADYYTASAFYLKSAAKYQYTGWQTINNITYYYDKNGKVVTGEQVIQGVKYQFASDGALSMGDGTLGIDVSSWNGNINWTAVKNSGVSYAIIRCGYRGYSTGVLVQDSKFKANIEGAIAAGIKVGVYIYSQAMNEVEAVQEASMVLDMIKGYRISYPVFIDIEKSGGRADSISKETRTAVANAFCATVQNSGYTAGVYANKDWFTNHINASQLSSYKIWLAQYNTQPTYSGRYDMWQYSDKGSIGGISGNVDLNRSYLGY